MLRSRKSRREEPLGAYLPEPIVSREGAVDPEHGFEAMSTKRQACPRVVAPMCYRYGSDVLKQWPRGMEDRRRAWLRKPSAGPVT
jgi:hypothetical protein